jgi:tRNA(Arg) A34 adenosine deaminase TadA
MDVDTLDHGPHIERTIEMAAEAARRGDRPCGSVLVRDDAVLRGETNRVRTDDDIALHPELSLARWAARELSPTKRAESVVYTTVEPCSMCAYAVATVGLGGVVFCVSGANYWETVAAFRESVPDGYLPCAEVIERSGGSVPVVGPVREAEGLDVVRATLEP